MALREADGVRLVTHNGNDFIKRFFLVVAAVTALPARLLRGHRVEAARLDLPHRSIAAMVKVKNSAAPAVRCEAEEDWGR